MESMSVADVLALSRTTEHDGAFSTGSAGFLWVILIFLFFLAFGGNGFGFGNNGNNVQLSQLERDVLNGTCNTQKEVLESRYTTQLGFQGIQAQMSECCCDIKNAIHAEGEATRGLIQANTIQELRDNLQAAQLQLGQLSQTSTIINTLQPTAKPAYLTCSPYMSYGFPWNNFGFGCGGCNGCGTI